MIGLPPTAGFFSKYLLLSAALDAGGFSGYAAFAALILSSLLGAVYFLRLLEAAWFRAPARGTILDRRRSKASSPVRLPLPLSIAVGLLAASLVAVGVLSASVERRLPEWPLTAQAAPSFPIQLVP